MRPDTCAKAGNHCASTPSLAMRESVSTARGPRIKPMNAARASASASV